MGLSEIEVAELEERGIARAEVERQLELFRTPPGYADLVRSCAVGDGIERLAEAEREAACAACERARAAGRLTKFVPASGAASRMFQALQAFLDREQPLDELRRAAAAGDSMADIVVRFADHVGRFAFADELAGEMRRRGDDLTEAVRRGDLRPVVEALIAPDGLAYADMPKGLLPFHRYESGARTAFEEHLREAADLVRDAQGLVRLHFTVSPEHEAAFRDALAERRATVEADRDCIFEVEFSTQSPHSDTIAVDLENRPFRDAEGRVVFRPGGHGALLENLDACGADIALLQNVDNIQPESRRSPSVLWKRVLLGRLVQLEEERTAALAAADVHRLRALCRSLGLAADGVDDAALVELVDRPMRVCGVVPNTGEPGGGPFWVRGRDGTVSRQIVESAQVDPGSPPQQGVFRAATHFNPVLLACSLRDAAGRPYDLRRYVDPRAVFIARKSMGGRDLKALERPGLWNGSMAHWGTVFVEIGDEAFTPVKTVVDLLRPEHLEIRQD